MLIQHCGPDLRIAISKPLLFRSCSLQRDGLFAISPRSGSIWQVAFSTWGTALALSVLMEFIVVGPAEYIYRLATRPVFSRSIPEAGGLGPDAIDAF